MEKSQASIAEHEVTQCFQGSWAQKAQWLYIYLSMPRLHVPCK